MLFIGQLQRQIQENFKRKLKTSKRSLNNHAAIWIIIVSLSVVVIHNSL